MHNAATVIIKSGSVWQCPNGIRWRKHDVEQRAHKDNKGSKGSKMLTVIIMYLQHVESMLQLTVASWYNGRREQC